MADFSTIGNWLERKVDQRLHKVSEHVSNSAYTFVNSAIYETPVDTSKALSNWRVGVGAGVNGEIEAYVLGSKGSTASASRGQATALASAKLDTRKLGETIYIINHVQYIGDLNRGSSRQAPSGYITDLILKLGTDIKAGL